LQLISRAAKLMKLKTFLRRRIDQVPSTPPQIADNAGQVSPLDFWL
jgi:hypothetical protein